MVQDQTFNLDNLVSTHDSRVLSLRIKNTYKISPHAKAQRTPRTTLATLIVSHMLHAFPEFGGR